MPWIEVTIRTSHEGAELITDTLLAMGAEGIITNDPYDFEHLEDDGFGIIKPEIETLYDSSDVILQAYVDTSLHSIEEYKTIIKSELQGLQENFSMNWGSMELSLAMADESHWDDWKDLYPPLTIVDGITIVPTWSDYEPSTGESLIRLEPGLAFGTGDHPTTRLAIQSLAQKVTPQSIVFDVGTGSGIIAFSAARLGSSHVYAYDLDTAATENARHHVTLNKLEAQVTVGENNLLQHIEEKAHIIVANIVTPILTLLLDDAYRCLYPHGTFIMSGIQEGEEETLLPLLIELGFTNIQCSKEDGWVCITCEK